jgi:alkylated DNA repair protein (DNA oxidative demethylase)
MAAPGFRLYPGYFDAPSQAALRDAVLAAAREGPFYRAVTPSGKPMSVEMTNFGPLGWVTDAAGYRYQRLHPVTHRPWPPIPHMARDLWRSLAGSDIDADCCLVNRYGEGARMGPHQDRDEADFAFPVLSVSLGDTAVFRIGGTTRRAPSQSLRLASGDVCVLAGEARLAFHGVDRIIAGSSRLIEGGGRLNLTLRRAAPV